jgi:hypothetical protein
MNIRRALKAGVAVLVLGTGAAVAISVPGEAQSPPPAGSRPYSDSSPFNVPVGSSPAVLGNSAAIVANSGMSGGKPSAISTARGESNNYDHPLYYPKASDPLVTLRFQNTAASALNGTKVPLPNSAITAGGSDHHIGIVWDGWEYNLWATSKSGSAGNYTFTSQIGGRMRADGPGIKTPALAQQYGSSYDGGTEAKFGLGAGIISAAELQSGRIDHALFVVASGSTGNWVYPGFNASAQGDANGTRPNMGTRFWLDLSDAEIDATTAPAWEKVIAHAAHGYGIYVGDKGGAGFSFMLESNTPYASAGVASPWDAYWPGQGVRRDATWGYNATFKSTAIWSHLKAIAAPPAA